MGPDTWPCHQHNAIDMDTMAPCMAPGVPSTYPSKSCKEVLSREGIARSACAKFALAGGCDWPATSHPRRHRSERDSWTELAAYVAMYGLCACWTCARLSNRHQNAFGGSAPAAPCCNDAACNLHCAYCYYSSEMSNTKDHSSTGSLMLKCNQIHLSFTVNVEQDSNSNHC
jgi:sulfatase maturation enzyme AslB (radical SAM superfamily)